MDKRIENAMNELINTEIWSTGLYLSLQVYFEDERLPILSSWLNSPSTGQYEQGLSDDESDMP